MAGTLTPRERQVSAFAAAGLRSRQIAAILGLSVRTIENQLQSVYGKTATGSRVQLLNWLTEHDPAALADGPDSIWSYPP